MSDSIKRGFAIRDIVDLLQAVVQKVDRKDYNLVRDLLEALALDATNVIFNDDSVKPNHAGGNGWLSAAINHEAGILTEFWIIALSKGNDTSTTEIEKRFPESYRKVFQKILDGNGYGCQLGRVIMMRHFSFFVSLDHDWTMSKLKPLLHWDSNYREAERVWDGFLYCGTIFYDFIPLFLPLYEAAFKNLHSKEHDAVSSLCQHVAIISLSGLFNPWKDKWLTTFILARSDEELEQWSWAMCNSLHDLDNIAKQKLWYDWLKDYIHDRFNGKPKPFTEKELRTVYDWSLEMGSVFPNIAKILLTKPAPCYDDISFFHALSENNLIQKYPEPVAKLVLHVLKSMPLTQNNLPLYGVDEVVGKLKDAGVKEGLLLEIRNKLTELGWLPK